MTRAPRRYQIEEGGIYHVVARGNNRMKLFRDDGDFNLYRSLLPYAKNKFGIEIFHYSLMPNHVHLMLRLEKRKLSEFMHQIQTTYAKYFCKKYAFIGHVWQARFTSSEINSDAYLFACGNYIEINALRAGLVKRPEDWPYCSYRVYAFGEHDNLIEIDPFYETLAYSPKKRREKYRQLVHRTRAS